MSASRLASTPGGGGGFLGGLAMPGFTRWAQPNKAPPQRPGEETSSGSLSPTGAVGRAGHGLERGRDDIGIHADAPQDLAGAGFRLDVAHRLRIFAGPCGMLVIIAHPHPDAAVLGERLDI